MFGFKLSVLSPHFVPEDKISFFNNAYDTWEDTFSKLLAASNAELDHDDFFRCDHILVITHQQEVVALATLTLFDLRLHSSKDHHYVQALNKSTTRGLEEEDLNRLVSIEYLTVLPQWRRATSEVDWVEVLLGLSALALDSSPAGDVIIGTPRVDVKVDRACRNVGAIQLQEPMNKMNYPCSVMIIKKQIDRHFTNENTERYAQHLWRNREEIGVQLFKHLEIFKKTAA